MNHLLKFELILTLSLLFFGMLILLLSGPDSIPKPCESMNVTGCQKFHDMNYEELVIYNTKSILIILINRLLKDFELMVITFSWGITPSMRMLSCISSNMT